MELEPDGVENDDPVESSDENGAAATEPVEPGELVYESNPKHSEPWQPGRKGALCDDEVRPHVQQLLEASEQVKGKRYAVHDGKPYCAQEHRSGRWHGYPIGWREVPAKLKNQ